jgi:hypothetical protein
MNTGICRGVVRGGMVLLEPEATLPEGTAVVVTPVGGEPGTPAAILSVVDAAPHVPAAWVDELEKVIAEGRRLPTHVDLLSDE